MPGRRSGVDDGSLTNAADSRQAHEQAEKPEVPLFPPCSATRWRATRSPLGKAKGYGVPSHVEGSEAPEESQSNGPRIAKRALTSFAAGLR